MYHRTERLHVTRRMIVLSLAVLVCVAAVCVWAGRGPRTRELLREVYTPTFETVPPMAPIGETIAELRRDLASPAGHAFLVRLGAGQRGVLWIALLVTLGVAFDVSRRRSSRNVDLILMLALGLMFFDMMRFFRVRLDPAYWRLLDLVYSAIFTLNAALLVRALWRVRWQSLPSAWQPNLRGPVLAALALVLVAADVGAALTRTPDDAGYFVNLGAQRLRERGRLPYGDPLLTGTPGAAYGPVLYAAHVPFQVLMDPRSPNPGPNTRPPLGDAATYVLPPPLATKLCTITLHLAGVLALFIIGLRLTGQPDVGWALVALYCGSGFVLGIGGDEEFIGGMTFVSHIGPAALTLIAFACLPIPTLAGALLAVSVGAGFYPAFMLPAWAGYFWRDRPRLVRFLAGFALAAAVIGGATLALSRPANGRGLIGTILNDTFGHHTDPRGYGRSPFGFWGQREGIRRWLMTPLVGESSLATPFYAVFYALVAATFVLARGASAAQLASLTASIAIMAMLVKVQSTGTYVAWAYPFLLIGIVANGTRPASDRIIVVQ